MGAYVRSGIEPPGARRPAPPAPRPRPSQVVEIRHVADPGFAAELAALRGEVARLREALVTYVAAREEPRR